MKKIFAFWIKWLARLTPRSTPIAAPSTPLAQTIDQAASAPRIPAEPQPTVAPPPVFGRSGEPADFWNAGFRSVLRIKDDSKPPQTKPLPKATREEVLAELANLEDVPALKSLAENFSRLLGQPNITLEEIVEAISKDSILCLTILRMANSVDVALSARVESVELAVQMLGVVRVRRAAQAHELMRGSESERTPLDWRPLWVHSLATAIIAEKLAEVLRLGQPQQLYIAGLLHDVGKVALSSVFPGTYQNILLNAWAGDDTLESLEHQGFGVDHCEAGTIFAGKSRMNPLVLQSVAHHGAPENASSHRAEVAAVHIANHLAKAYGIGFSGTKFDPQHAPLKSLTAWTVLMAETGRRHDVESFCVLMDPFLCALASDLDVVLKNL